MAVNTFVIWGTTLLRMIPPLIMVPFLIRNIGESGYGEYALLWSLLMAIEQLEISLQSGSIKYGAACIAENRIGDLNKLLSSTFAYSILLAVLSCLAVIVLSLANSNATEGMKISLQIVGLMMLFLVPTTPFIGIIKAKQRFFIDSLAGILAQYAGLVFIVLWFRIFQPSVEAVIAISVGTLLLSRLTQLPIAYKLIPGLQNRLKHFDWKIFRLVVGFGIMIVLSALCNVANTTGIRWLSGMLVSTTFVAHLAIFLMPGVFLASIVQAMTITVMPAASGYQATQNSSMLKELFLKSTRYTVLLVSGGLLASILLMRSILNIWVGPQYEFLYVYALINLSGISVLLSASSAHHMLKGFGALRQILFAYALGLAVIPILIFLMIFSIWKSPYIAISAGLFLGNVLAGVVQIRFCSKAVRMNLRQFLRRAFIEPIVPAVLSLALALGTIALTGLRGFKGSFAVTILSIIIFFSSFYFFIASKKEREQLKGLLQMIWSKSAVFVRRVIPSAVRPDV